MFEFLVYLLYRAVFAILAAFPLRIVVFLGNALGYCAWATSAKYRHLAFRNATIAFGQTKSPAERRALVRRHFARLGSNLLCSLKLAAMPPEQVRARVTIDNLDAVERELRASRGVVVVISHLANWELHAQTFPMLIDYARSGTVFQPLRNRYIDRHFRKLRGRTGLELFNRDDGFDQVIDLLRGGGVIGILSDQHAGDHGLWTPFFNRLASTTTLPALLAKRTGAALIGNAVYTDGPARWRIVFSEKINAPGDSVDVMTAKMNRSIASQIQRAPEDWFWVHNRWKTPQPNFLLPDYKRGVFIPDEDKQLQPFRILIRSSNWLGDSIMSIPAVRAIKAGRPDAHVTVAVPEKISSIWKLVPEIDAIISLPKKSLFETVRLLKQEPRFDVGIAFPNSVRSALELWLAGMDRRVGYRGTGRAALLNQFVREPKKPRPPVHQAERYLQLAVFCGASKKMPLELRPLNQTTNIQHQTAPLALCPGAEYGPAKRWPPEQFATVAKAIGERDKARWILFGSKNEIEIGQQIANLLGQNCTNRVGETSIDQLIVELKQCRLLVTNDTGTMHLAALLGVPLVAIFGSTEPKLTGPLGDNHIVIRHHVECSPCFLRQCPIDFRCMKSVTADEVIDAVVKILERGEQA